MSRSKVIDISEYKANKNILKGRAGNACVPITLDTSGPSVNISSSISYQDNTVTFWLNDISSDSISFKTWGDYDTSAAGLNHDLCGDTEAHAPWVDIVPEISYSLGDTSFTQHVFYYKLRDDVWNETAITVEGEYEPTVLIDVSDFVITKEQYLNLMMYEDSGLQVAHSIAGSANLDFVYYREFVTGNELFGEDLINYREQYLNMILGDDFGLSLFDYEFKVRGFDKFSYNEEIADPDSHRPAVVFGKDAINAHEIISMQFPVSYRSMYKSDTIITAPMSLVPELVQDTGYANADILARDAVNASFDLNFMYNDLTENSIIQDTGLVNAAFSEASGPYGAFYYFAVTLKIPLNGKESMSFMQPASDFVSYSENLLQVIPMGVTVKSSSVYTFKDLLLQKEKLSGKTDLTLDLFYSDKFTGYDEAIPELNTYEISWQFEKGWPNVDHLTSDMGKAVESLMTTLPMDYFGISYEDSLLDVALYDIGRQPAPPEWSFDVNAVEALTSKESFITSLLDTDSVLSYESALFNMPFIQPTTIPDPDWTFSVNALDIVESKDVSANLISGADWLYAGETVINTVWVHYHVKEFTKAWADADQLMYDWSYGSDSSVLSSEIYDYGIQSDSVIFTFYDIDFGVGTDKLVSFGKDYKDSGSGFEASDFIIEALEKFLLTDTGMITFPLTDALIPKESHAGIDADILVKDLIPGTEKSALSIPVEDFFVVSDVPVISVLCWEVGVPRFVVSIHKEEGETKYIYEFEFGWGADWGNIEHRNLDENRGYDSAEVSLCEVETGYYRDVLIHFSKMYFENIIGFDVLTELDLWTSETGAVEMSPMVNLFSNELATPADILSIFHKIISDIGKGIEENAGLDLLSEDYIRSIFSAVINPTGKDYAIGEDKFGIFHKIIQDYTSGKDTGLLSALATDLSISLPSLILGTYASDDFTGKDVLTEFHKILVSLAFSKESQVISQFTVDTGITVSDAMLSLFTNEFGLVNTEKQKLLVYVLSKQPVQGTEFSVTTLLGQEFLYTAASAMILPCGFDVFEESEKATLKALLLQKDKPVAFDNLIITVSGSDLLREQVETIITLAETDTGIASFYYDIDDGDNRYYVDVFDLGYVKESVPLLSMPVYDLFTVTIESAAINVTGKDLDNKGFDLFNKEFTSLDTGIRCYTTVIYDPTITQRELIYWWEPGYLPGDYITPLIKNPKWGEPITVDDSDYPYEPWDPEYPNPVIPKIEGYVYDYSDKVIGSFAKTFATDPSHYHTGGSVSLGGTTWVQSKWTSNSLVRLFGPMYMHYQRVHEFFGEYYYDFRVILCHGASGYGSYAIVDRTVSLRNKIDIVKISETDSEEVAPIGPEYKDVTYMIYKKGTTTPYEFAEEDLMSFFNFYHFYDVSYWVVFEFEMYTYCYPAGSTPRLTYVNIDCETVSNLRIVDYIYDDFYTSCRPEYIKDPSKNDELFLPTDDYPGLITYKLYINQTCSTAESLDWEPKDRMEQFVLDKMTKYMHLDWYMQFPGYIAPVSEDPVVWLTDNTDEGVGHEWVTDRAYTMLDVAYHCENTIIYDTTILQRELLYWWDPGYPPGGNYKTRKVNTLWGKDILPGEIDYPYYKGDSKYGKPVAFYDDALGVYDSWDANTSWIGDGTTSLKEVSNTNVLFKTTASKFIFRTLHVDVTEFYLVTADFIPWSTLFDVYIEGFHYESPGSYVSMGKHLLADHLSIVSQEWTDDHKRITVYDIEPVEQEVNCLSLFSGYDITRDYFVVTLTCRYYWSSTWYEGVFYQLTADYMYYGNYQEPSELYKKSRRMYIYDSDDWFLPTDEVYFEPTIYKLYLNLDCGITPEMDRIPENPMDKFVLDKMTKYSRLNIVAPFIGDHIDVEAAPVIGLAEKLEIQTIVHWEVKYTLLFFDYGYTCEDIVVYSESDFQDRDIMYWWEKGYPVVTDDKVKVPNPLLGKPIEVKDFDYPYTPDGLEYGKIFYPGKHGVRGDFAPYSYAKKDTDYLLKINLFFPIRKLTDGVELLLSGHVRTDIGKVKLSLALWYSPTAPTSSPIQVYDGSWLFYRIIKEIVEVEPILIRDTYFDTEDFEWKDAEYKFVDTPFRNLNITLRSQDIYNDDWYLETVAEDLHLGLLFQIIPQKINGLNNREGYDVRMETSVGVEEYDKEYLSYRAPGMYPTDVGFVTRDFYEDFFGFKFYVNLGCGPDLDAFPLEYNSDFERWVFTTARLGNRNLDYVFNGDLGTVYEYPIVELYEFWMIDVHFRIIFNNFEFTVVDNGLLNYDLGLDLLGSDDGLLIEKSPTIEFLKYIDLVHSFTLNLENRTTLHEYGDIEVTPLMDLYTSDKNTSFMEASVFDFYMNEYGKVDFNTILVCEIILRENLLGVGQELLAVPVDDWFRYDDGSVITLPVVSDTVGIDQSKLVEFIYVFEDILTSIIPLLRKPLENNYISTDETYISPCLDYVGEVSEMIVPHKNEIYRDIGYVCFWVQVVNYPYVIDWLAGHYVDYFHKTMEAEFVRLISCFGNPPGGWPTYDVYPTPDKILPSGGEGMNILRVDPSKYPRKYRHTVPISYPRRRVHGYIVFPGPGGGATYVIDPVDTPKPYKWAGGTSILVTKSIYDKNMQNYLAVVDEFYFALFDEDNNRVSKVKRLVMKDAAMPGGGVSNGTSFGALVFTDLEPSTTYFVRETDKYGNLLSASLTSDFSGNKYILPQDSLKISTNEEGKCVDAGDMPNLVESFGKGPTGKLPGNGDNYDPWIQPEDEMGPFPGGVVPFNVIDPPYPIPPGPIPPEADNDFLPPIIPEFITPTPPVPYPIKPIVGYTGKQIRTVDTPQIRKKVVTNIPVDMYARIWTYHYIPATFILELTGMNIDFLDDFDFEIEEPFKFDIEGFSFEFEEPFRFDVAGFNIELYKGFAFDEYPFILEYTQEFYLDETKFEFEMTFEDFQFGWIEYDGEQMTPAPEVIADVVTFDGYSHPLCYPRGAYGTILYQVDGEETTWSTMIPERTDAGQYNVNWFSRASLQYLGYGSEKDYHTTICTILKATPEILIDRVTVDYDEVKDVVFTYIGDGEVICKAENTGNCSCKIISQEPVELTPKPVYRVTMELIGLDCGFTSIHIISTVGDNFMAADHVIRCAVYEATMSFIALPVVVPFTGNPITGDITVFGPTQYQIWYSPEPITKDTANNHKVVDFFTEAGEYTVYFVIKADNYKPAYGKFNLTIEMLPQDITIITYNEVYDYMAHPLIISVIGNYGDMWYSVDKVDWSPNIPVGALPGKYTIYWYCVGDANHYDEGTREYPNVVTAEIEKMDIVAYIEDQVLDMADPEYVIVEIPTPSTGALLLTYSDYSVILAELQGYSVSIYPLKKGNVFVYVKQFESLLYKAHTFSFRVEVVDSRIEYETVPVITVFNNEIVDQSGLIVLVPDQSVCTIRYSKNPITPSSSGLVPVPAFYKNAGEYKIYFMIGAYGYTSVYDFYELIINKAPNHATAKGINVVYDGRQHNLIEVELGYYGTIYYSLTGNFWTTNIPHSDTPGEYTVYWYCRGDSNHEDYGSMSSPWIVNSKIAKRTVPVYPIELTLYVTQLNFTYQIITPSTGYFDPIQYSTSEFINPDYTYIDNDPLGLLHIRPKDAGTFTMTIHQRATTYYEDATFIANVVIKSLDILVRGKVISATTAEGISGATVEFMKIPGTSFDKSTQTDQNGEYRINLAKGRYLVKVSCDGYITEYYTVGVSEDTTFFDNFVLVPVVDKVIAVLTWGAEPNDLDLYIERTPYGGKTPFRVYYGQKTYYEDGNLIAELDVDNTSGYGPETVSLYNTSGEFIIYVKDFHKTSLPLNATLKVYLPGGTTPSVEVNCNQVVGSHAWVAVKILNGVVTIVDDIEDI